MNRKYKVPYVDLASQHLRIKEELINAFSSVLDHGKFILGDEVREIEQKISDLCGTQYSVGINSGTDALIFALRALEIGPGDEVITVPNSFVASTSCIKIQGASPIFVDVGDDYNINPDLIEPAITKKTKAILLVHLTGRPANMDPVMEIAKKYNLFVIEDCAQAISAEYKNKKVGSIGDIGCFSFHPLKTLNACGDAGMLTTNKQDLAEKFRLMRNIGKKTRDDSVIWSGNSRLDTLQAAFLLVKMRYLETWTEKRRANARFYQEKLKDLKQVQVPLDKPYEKAVYHTFVIQADNRDGLRSFLEEQGIGSNVHYPVPIHLQEAAKDMGYTKGKFPITESQASRILSLPVYPELTEADLQYVVDSIHKYYQE
jgi:dTDP-4-amino-4,6-dideoxygalactose transaminase